MNTNIAFIGSVGVPNNYGGFEMFLDSCGPSFAKSFDKVYITCDSGRYSDKEASWFGVCRIFIPIRANGFQSVLHDLVAFCSVFWRVKVIVVLGVSAGLLFPFFKIFCSLSGKKLIVNIDGIESRRAKFSLSKRLFLYWSDKLAQRFAHSVVIDNEALRKYLEPNVKSSAVMIAYPGDHVVRVIRKSQYPLGYSKKYLTICRIEPENQCHLLLESFALAGRGFYTFIGNWNGSEYGRNLRKQFNFVPNLHMLDPIYDKLILADYRENCDCYLHGHSVGGTNPSLVEMLFYDCNILAYDCEFNRFTAGDSIEYFDGTDDLCKKLARSNAIVPCDRSDLRDKYTRKQICSSYTALIFSLLKDEKFS